MIIVLLIMKISANLIIIRNKMWHLISIIKKNFHSTNNVLDKKNIYIIVLLTWLFFLLPLVILIHQNYELYHSIQILQNNLTLELNFHKEQIKSLNDLNHKQNLQITELQNTLNQMKIKEQVLQARDDYPKTLQSLLVKGIVMISMHIGQRLVL